MDKILIATRDGNNEEVVRLCKAQLAKNPHDVSNHFSIAQAYECLGEYDLAIKHVEKSLSGSPTFLESYSIANRCLSNLGRYDEAYSYAKRGIDESQAIKISKTFYTLSNFVSYIPGLKVLRNLQSKDASTRKEQIRKLNEFVLWYESKQTTLQ